MDFPTEICIQTARWQGVPKSQRTYGLYVSNLISWYSNSVCMNIQPLIRSVLSETRHGAIPNIFIPEYKHPTTWLSQGCWDDEIESIENLDQQNYEDKMQEIRIKRGNI